MTRPISDFMKHLKVTKISFKGQRKISNGAFGVGLECLECFHPLFKLLSWGAAPGFGAAASPSRGSSATAGSADSAGFFLVFFGFLRRNDAFLFLVFLSLAFFSGLASCCNKISLRWEEKWTKVDHHMGAPFQGLYIDLRHCVIWSILNTVQMYTS